MFFPYETFSLDTQLSPPEIVERLKRKVHTESTLLTMFIDESYKGEVGSNVFEIWRIHTRNMVPIVTGTFAESKNGTRIQVDLFPCDSMYITFCMFVFFNLFIWAVTLFTQPSLTQAFNQVGLILFVTIVVYGYTMAYFNYNSERAKNFLMNVLEAKPAAN